MIVGKKLSSKKAREILHHGSVHGHSLTEKQRRYFGWVAGGESGYGGGDNNSVVSLLNQRTKESSRKALDMLCNMFNLNDEEVGLEFSGCEEKPVSPIYPPFRTGYANRVRIHICSDSLGDAFNAIQSKQIFYDPKKITHYCAVFLHEFAHVLDKRGLLPSEYGGFYKKDIERRADHWAQSFLNSL
jgi:hypothetical protein